MAVVVISFSSHYFTHTTHYFMHQPNKDTGAAVNNLCNVLVGLHELHAILESMLWLRVSARCHWMRKTNWI